MDSETRRLVDDAVDAFETYKSDVAEGDFGSAGEALDELNSLLEDVRNAVEEMPAGTDASGANQNGAGADASDIEQSIEGESSTEEAPSEAE